MESSCGLRLSSVDSASPAALRCCWSCGTVRRGGAAGFCGDHLGSWTLDGAEGLACLVGFWSLAIELFDIGMYDEGICGRLFCLDRRNGMFAYRCL